MFMMSIRLSRKRILLGAAALLATVGLCTAGVHIFSGDIATSAPVAGESSAKPKKVTVKTNDERLAFIRGFGWELEPDPVEVLEVIIPEEFDQIYAEYNSLQKKQGYDLSDYSGKRCKRYSYRVMNYPGEAGEVRVSLLLYGDRVIGGDVSSTDKDGFIHGFAAPAAESSQ